MVRGKIEIEIIPDGGIVGEIGSDTETLTKIKESVSRGSKQ